MVNLVFSTMDDLLQEMVPENHQSLHYSCKQAVPAVVSTKQNFPRSNPHSSEPAFHTHSYKSHHSSRIINTSTFNEPHVWSSTIVIKAYLR